RIDLIPSPCHCCAMASLSPWERELSIDQRLADAELLCFLQHGGTESDVGQRQAAMPAQDRFAIILAAGLLAGDDFRELAMDARLADEARIDMRPERAELAGAKLAEIIDDDLVHDRGHGEFERAHRAIGDHAGALFYPRRLEYLFARVMRPGRDDEASRFKPALPVLRLSVLVVALS